MAAAMDEGLSPEDDQLASVSSHDNVKAFHLLDNEICTLKGLSERVILECDSGDEPDLFGIPRTDPEDESDQEDDVPGRGSLDAMWGQLPDELLALIMKRLTTLSSVIRFSVVCREWRKVATEDGDLLARRPPSLLLPMNTSDPAAFCLYCPFVPNYQSLKGLRLQHLDRIVGGSLDGWLVEMTVNYVPHLVNPLLERRIPLPMRWLEKAALSRGRGGKDFTVMAIDAYRTSLLLARPGDKRWRQISHQDCRFTDIIRYKGRFHALNEDGRLVAIEDQSEDGGDLVLSFIVMQPLISLNDLRRPLAAFYSRMRLVESSSGELLLVKYHYEDLSRDPYRVPIRFSVFKLVEHKKAKPLWMKVESLGEDALFLSDNVSAAVSATTTASSGCTRNCIYFFASLYRDCVYVYSMEKGSIVDRYSFNDVPGLSFSTRLCGLKDQCLWLFDRKL